MKMIAPITDASACYAGWRTQCDDPVRRRAFCLSCPRPRSLPAWCISPPREATAPCDLAMLEKVTQAAFGQRRKMLRQSLKGIHPDPVALLTPLGIAPTARAEELGVADFLAIANALAGTR